jgi:uncharacterized membrane protein (UPF0127 family)
LPALVVLLAGCSRTPQVLIHTSNGAEIRVPVELAVTDGERRRGLMYRRDLDANAGMLFIFPETAHQPFWMKNTPLSLDMIFIAEDMHIVGVVENTVPFSTKQVGVKHPSRYVLEVNAGFVERSGIAAGDKIELRNVSRTTPSP